MSSRSGRRIAVLAGGPSCEREISLLSGRAVFDALAAKGYDVLMIDPDTGIADRLKKENADIAFIALHGSFGEDGTIQRILDQAGIPYTGCGAQTSEIAFDKARSQPRLREAGVRVPAFTVLARGASMPADARFPVFVKPAKAGSSVGISIAANEAELAEAIAGAFRFSDEVLLEEYIRGRELTVGFLGEEALPVVEVIAQRKFYDYEAKYGNAGTRYEFPAKLSAAEEKAVMDAARAAYAALGCDVMGRVDVILGADGKPYVLEINTIPGLTAKSLLPKAAQAKGIDFGGLCDRILELSRRKAEAWSSR